MQANENFVSNLKLLAFSVLYAWKKIVVVALILGLLLGGLQAYKASKKAPETTTATTENTTTTAPQLTAAQKNNLEQYEYWIDVAEKNVERQTTYIENSIYMDLDYNHVWKAEKVYYVDTNYQILPENVYQEPDHTESLVALYLKYAQAADLTEKIAAEIGTTPRYAQELILIESEDATFTVTVLYHDQETAAKIMVLIDTQIQTASAELATSVGTHELIALIDTCSEQVDTNVYYTQQASEQKLLEHLTSLYKLEGEYKELKKSYTPAAPEADPAASAETADAPSFKKMAIIGFAIGFVLMAAVALLGTIFSDKITTEKKLANKFSFAVLGALVQEDKKRDVITRLIRKLDGKLNNNTESNSQYVAQNLVNHVGDSKNVLVCCDTGEAAAQFVAETLKQYTGEVTLVAAGSMSSDAQALKLLKSTDKLVFAVTMGKTCSAQLSVAATLAQQAEKPVAGIVIVD